MNANIKELKNKLKNEAPIVVYNKLEKYRIPSPYKEIIELICIRKMHVYPAILELKDSYNIHLSYWDFINKTNKSLKMFAESERIQK